MENQFLSIQQMKNLRSLGIDTTGASMMFVEYPSDSGLMRLISKTSNLIEGIDIFSLSDLLYIIPPRLGKKYIFKLYKVGDSFLAEYSYNSITPALYVSPLGSPLETVYNTLIWVVKNNHLPKKFIYIHVDS